MDDQAFSTKMSKMKGQVDKNDQLMESMMKD